MLEVVLLGVVVFLLALVGDYAETTYVRAVADGHGPRAALMSVAMYGAGAVGFLALVEVSRWMLLPEAGGLFAGTLLAMRPR
jgi:hypothetical protein